MMTVLTISTFIAASPENVRAVFLDWPNVAKWDKHYLKTITPLLEDGSPSPDGSGLNVKAGPRVEGTFWGGSAQLTILENTPEKLVWNGVWLGLSVIKTFTYTTALDEEGRQRTLFVQTEEERLFMGAMLAADKWLGGGLRKKFEGFSGDLKGECERS